MQEIAFHPEAELEISYGAAYYEEQCEGLGLRFLRDLDEAVQGVLDYPTAWPIVEFNVRRHQLQHFPYGICYLIAGSQIRILAVSHLHREPGYWRERKSK